MDLTVTICNIIEQGSKSTLRYSLTPAAHKIPKRFHNYLGILQQLDLIVTSLSQLAIAFKTLKQELMDYLLGYIVSYFEETMYDSIKHFDKFFPRNKKSACHNRSYNFMYDFYTCLTSNTNVYLNDIHVLAFIYVEYFGNEYMNIHALSYGANISPWDNIPRHAISYDYKLQRYLEKYILKEPRLLSIGFKKLVENALKNHGKIITMKPYSAFGIFACNNIEQLNLFDFNTQNRLLNSPTISQDYLSSKTIKYALSIFEYGRLGESQILACLNSQFVLKHLQKRRHRDDYHYYYVQNDIRSRMVYWIDTLPSLAKCINTDIASYFNAFQLMCYYWNSLSNGEKTRNLAINTIFNEHNMKYLFNRDSVWLPNPYSRKHHVVNIVEMCIAVFTPVKLVDDDFILNILYNNIYESIFPANHRDLDYLSRVVIKGSTVWYDFNEYATNPKTRKNNPQIIIKGTKLIRNKACIEHFMTKLGINDFHLKLLSEPQTVEHNRSKIDSALKLLGSLVQRSRRKNNKLFTLSFV